HCNPTPPTCADALGLVTASDTCSGSITPTCQAGAVQDVGACGKKQTFTLTPFPYSTLFRSCPVTYTWTVDMTGPMFTGCPSGPIDLQCNPTPPTWSDALVLVTASDTCSGSITPTCSPGAVQDVGACGKKQTFTLTATDACGN